MHATDGANPAPLAVGRLAVLPLPCGALWLPDHGAVLVADLHLGKGASYARRGVMLPPYDTRATLERLGATLAALAPRRVIALGDSFHESAGASQLSGEDARLLATLQTGRDWLWIAGNHDPDLPAAVGGDRADALDLDGTTLRHEPAGPDSPDRGGEHPAEIAGHLHPVARVSLRGRSVRRRCFALAPGRMVMPAFGAYAGGLNLRDPAFDRLFPRRPTAHMLGDARVFAVHWRLLLPD